MRLSILSLMFLAILAAGAETAAQPADVTLRNGVWTMADGRPLHTTRLRFHLPCRYSAKCDDDWSVLAAPGEAARKDGWSTIPDRDSKSGWAWTYRSARLYLPPLAAVPDPSIPDAVMSALAFAVETDTLDYAEMKKRSPRRWIAPDFLGEPGQPDYPAASKRAEESGTVDLVYCVNRDGVAIYPEIARSSGYPRLDEATVKWVMRTRLTPASLNGRAVMVCKVPMQFSWNLQRAAPPSINR